MSFILFSAGAIKWNICWTGWIGYQFILRCTNLRSALKRSRGKTGPAVDFSFQLIPKFFTRDLHWSKGTRNLTFPCPPSLSSETQGPFVAGKGPEDSANETTEKKSFKTPAFLRQLLFSVVSTFPRPKCGAFGLQECPCSSLYSIPVAQTTFDTVKNLKIKYQTLHIVFFKLFVLFPFGKFVKN